MTHDAMRLGFICPSSNTAFEPAAWALLADRASMHVTRVGVTRISLGSDSDDQFDVAGMEAAARLLAEARVDVVAWAGTSGSWLGVDRERACATRCRPRPGSQRRRRRSPSSRPAGPTASTASDW